jgi:hypothetical protein
MTTLTYTTSWDTIAKRQRRAVRPGNDAAPSIELEVDGARRAGWTWRASEDHHCGDPGVESRQMIGPGGRGARDGVDKARRLPQGC